MSTTGSDEDEVRIVVTDSGLGGLSAAAYLVEQLKMARPYKRVRVIFFNCRPSDPQGYDPMDTFEQRQRTFSNALTYMKEAFTPEVIIVACNTLSVLYDETEFSREGGVRVMSIVEPGVELITRALRENDPLNVVLFATPTTISSGIYQKHFMGKERLFFQACPWLVLAIEESTTGPKTQNLIEQFVGEVVVRENLKSQVVGASLNCTHFGYAEALFRGAFEKQGIALAALLNPNEKLIDDFLAGLPKERHEGSSVDVEVVSHTTITPVVVASIYPSIRKMSEQTAEAFKKHRHTPLRFAIQ